MLLSADGFRNMDCWREARTTGRRDSSVDACRVGKCCTNTPRITALTGLVEIHRVWQNIRHEWKDQGESLACSWDPESTDLFHFISVLLFFQTACRKTFSLCSVSLNCLFSFLFWDTSGTLDLFRWSYLIDGISLLFFEEEMIMTLCSLVSNPPIFKCTPPQYWQTHICYCQCLFFCLFCKYTFISANIWWCD